jgi:hypothetical protein
MRTEIEISARLVKLLEPHFWVVSEVWLRDPVGGAHLRVDHIAIPRDPASLPFEFLAFEVKAERTDGAAYIQAFKQCIDYKRCVIDDERAKRAWGLFPSAVFLFRGDQRPAGVYQTRDETRWALVRLAGKFNVGDAIDDPQDGLSLLISDSRIWTAQKGLTGRGLQWPQARRVGNSKRRAA